MTFPVDCHMPEETKPEGDKEERSEHQLKHYFFPGLHFGVM